MRTGSDGGVDARVLITGAAHGIGRATASALRQRGAQVVGLDLAASDDVLACDVTDQEAVDAAVAEAVHRLGGLDVLINNAGIGDPQSAGAAPAIDAERVIAVNLLGPWRVTSAALPALLEAPRGRVVNVASGLAHVTIPYSPAYTMSKRGVVAYSDALRAEYGTVLDVTTVYPGYIRTSIHDVAEQAGLRLGALVPEEPLSDAVDAMLRAALDAKPARDLATSRRGAISYAVARHLPRPWLDRIVSAVVHRAALAGTFNTGPAAGLAARLENAR